MSERSIIKIQVPQGGAEFERGVIDGTVFLSMQQQGYNLMTWWSRPAWNLTDPVGTCRVMRLKIVGTGQSWDDEKWFHLDSCCMADGDAWHLLARRDDGQED